MSWRLDESLLLADIAESMNLERRCCPFLNITLVLRADGTRWLEIGGSGPIKEFLRSEFAGGPSLTRQLAACGVDPRMRPASRRPSAHRPPCSGGTGNVRRPGAHHQADATNNNQPTEGRHAAGWIVQVMPNIKAGMDPVTAVTELIGTASRSISVFVVCAASGSTP